MIASLALSFLAGLLSTLSPCVLPLLPIVLGAAAGEHRLAPAALALGVALSFVTIGLFVATIGFAIGLDGEVFRKTAAVMLLVIGVVLMFPGLQSRVTAAASPVGDWANTRSRRVSRRAASKASSASDCCSARCGVHVSGRPLAPPPSSRRSDKISGKWR